MCKAVIPRALVSVVVNMKNPTIWESASRPLFVRSVWLESTNAGRGHHRHFILDYEPKKRKSLSSPTRLLKANLEHSVSCDLSDLDISNRILDAPKELFLIGSSKAKYQQQPAQQQQKLQQRSAFNYRRPSLSTKRHQSFEGFHKRRLTEIPDLYSRRSSLQDLQSSLSNACSNPDERLAERVLNWLDLAGKTSTILKVVDSHLGEMEACTNNKKPAKLRRNVNNATSNLQSRQHLQRSSTALSQRGAAAARKTVNNQQKHAAESTPHHRPDSVKHITIIFNKEGVPVRLNRPARNIDLCTMASSAETVRKLAGPLASARLYGSDNNGNCSSRRYGGGQVATAVNGSGRKQRDLDAVQTTVSTYSSAASKRLFDESNSFRDSKKQLHIFMPSLPKKGLLSATASGAGSTLAVVDDVTSILSNTFSEFCKM